MLTIIGLGLSLSAITAVSTNKTSNSTAKTSINTTAIDNIGQDESKFQDVQGVSEEATIAQQGYGDCWADSEYLYDKLTAAGVPVRIMGYENRGTGAGYRHAWIEINTGEGWQQWNYTKYHSAHYGDVGGGTPCVIIGPGNSTADILSTGY